MTNADKHRYKKYQITAPARAHLGLIGLSEGLPLINGGAGFAISKEAMKLTASMTEKAGVSLSFEGEHDSEIHTGIRNVVNNFQENHSELNLHINAQLLMKPHHGFGTGTASLMATAEILLLARGATYSHEEVRRLSGRGGTSGIGVHTYFSGGFIVDTGTKQVDPEWLPSERAARPHPSALFVIPMPSWKMGIAIPKETKAKTLDDEARFFSHSCPISSPESYRASYWLSYILPHYIKDNDYEGFCVALRNTQKLTWKSLERKQYGASLIRGEKLLYEAGANAVAMSSFGPSLIFFYRDETLSRANLSALDFHTLELDLDTNNRGRKIECYKQ